MSFVFANAIIGSFRSSIRMTFLVLHNYKRTAKIM